jgi:hypothetical protein
MTPVCAVLAALLVLGALAEDDGQAPSVGGFAPAAGAPSSAPDELGTPVYSVQFASRPADWSFPRDDMSRSSFDAAGLRLVLLEPMRVDWGSPVEDEVDQLQQKVTASIPAASPDDTQVGLVCVRDWGGKNELDYEFWVDRDGGWVVARLDEAANRSSEPVYLSEGAVTQRGGGPLTVSASCSSSGDHRVIRLRLSIGGVEATTLTDQANASSHGWRGGIDTVGSDQAGTKGVDDVVEVSSYSESDLGS